MTEFHKMAADFPQSGQVKEGERYKYSLQITIIRSEATSEKRGKKFEQIFHKRRYISDQLYEKILSIIDC